MPEIASYVCNDARQITPAILEKILQKLPMFKMEFTQISAPEFPHLFEQLEFLADLVEDFAEGADTQIPYVTLADAAFALLQVHERWERKDVSHADDSLLVRSVLITHHEALAAYARRHDVPWTGIETANP